VTSSIDDAPKGWKSARGSRDGGRARLAFAEAADPDPSRLVARLRNGEAAALEDLYAAYRKPVYGFLVRLARDRHLAEDLFQNTWIKISRSVARLREDTELRAWIFTVARNEFRSFRRWQLIDVTRVFAWHVQREEPLHSSAAESDRGVELATIETALATLGASDREVLLLVSAEGMSQEQAASVIGVSHAALRQRLARARARLKTAISELEGERGGSAKTKGRQP
jgi:RNA polymerase sigma-70 factor (ECF subfamily)